MASTGSSSSAPPSDAASADADIVVALTSYNDARTVGAVARAVREGLTRAFGGSRSLIVLADARSTDGTREAAREAAGPDALVELEPPAGPPLAEMPYHGHPGRAAALRAILQTAQRLGARACAFLDAGLDGAGPEWIERLVAPVMSGDFDFVAPYYVRRADEGAMTRGLVYPMFRTLYGVRLRQPAAGEFACSAPLGAQLLDADFWEATQAQVGIDLWLAAAAVRSGCRICEAPLGQRTALSRDPLPDLSTTLAQIVGALFADLEQHADVWQRTRRSVPVPVLGSAADPSGDAPSVNVEGLIESFRLGYRELREIWTWVLPARSILELGRLAIVPPERFRFDDRLWAAIVYDFALGYALRVMPHDHLLRSLTPIYTGWFASFVMQTAGASLPQIEERVEQVCLGFEAEKRYLIARWRWPEKLR